MNGDNQFLLKRKIYGIERFGLAAVKKKKKNYSIYAIVFLII